MKDSFKISILVGAATLGLFFLIVHHHEEKCSKQRLQGPQSQDDPQLIKKIRQRFIDDSAFTSRKPKSYNFSQGNPELDGQYGQPLVVEDHFNSMQGGFFIECGGFDGETLSNTLKLELHHKWTGILIEANPDSYKKLKSKNRKVFTLNSCLATSPFPEQVKFESMEDNDNSSYGQMYSGMAQANIRDNNQKVSLQVSSTAIVQCFPLYSILLALDNPTVHYLSLDVEGVEMQVLQTIPWDKVDIKMLIIEWKDEEDKIESYMSLQNYKLLKKIPHKFEGSELVFYKD